MNRLTIIGNLTRDPELRTTQTGKQVCTFTVAVNRRQKDASGNTMADFFRVSAWGQQGETCAKYLSKGRKVAIIGEVSVNAYQGGDGKPHGSLEVMAQEVEFLSGRSEAEQKSDQMVASATEAMSGGKRDPQSGMTKVEMSDDDLPF